MNTCANCGDTLTGHGPMPKSGHRYCMRRECQRVYAREYNAHARVRQGRITAPIPQRRGDLPPIGEIIADADGQRIQCHICGEFFASVARHSLLSHGVSGDAYRERFGLTRKQSLDSPQTQASNRARAIARGSRANLTLAGNAEFRGRPKGSAARISERVMRHIEGKARS